MAITPRVFVLLPAGIGVDWHGGPVNFDDVYQRLVGPAALAANLEVHRITNAEDLASVQPKDAVVADITTASAAIFFELGVRQLRPAASTVVLSATTSKIYEVLGAGRTLTYSVDANGNLVSESRVETLAKMLSAPPTELSIYDVLDAALYPGMLDHLKTDVFRDCVHYSLEWQQKLRFGREGGRLALQAVESELPDLDSAEPAAIVDLLLSWRSVKGWTEMIMLVEKAPEPLRSTVLMQEQYAFALNRSGYTKKAEGILRGLIASRGPMPETCALLGRVYKDGWEAALSAGDVAHASVLLDQAIATYLQGFDADRRDAYPGINALTLMNLRNPPDDRRHQLLALVQRAVDDKTSSSDRDYWDCATQLELAILGNDFGRAAEWLAAALPLVREKWEPETTARNLRLIREAREYRSEPSTGIREIEDELNFRSAG